MTRLRVAGKEKMQMSGLTCACLGAADMRGLCPHMKYPRLRRGIFFVQKTVIGIPPGQIERMYFWYDFNSINITF